MTLTVFSDTESPNYIARAVTAYLRKLQASSNDTFSSEITSTLSFLKSYVVVESNTFEENLAILSNGIYIQGAANVRSQNNKFTDNSIPIHY